MAERISETLQKKLSERLGFYEDLGISLFYRDRCAVEAHDRERQLESQVPAHFSTPDRQKEVTLPKPATKPTFQKAAPVTPQPSPKIASLPVVAGPSLFEAVDKIADDTLLKVRQDLTARGTQLFLATEIPRLNSFLSAKARAPMKTRKDCRSLAARENSLRR